MMNKEEIMDILPHRGPMLLVDEGYVDTEGYSHGFYTVRGDEWFLQGHFPDYPIVPGVIQCEMMAQSCCLLLADAVKGKNTLYSSMDKVRFKRQIVPGDKLEFICVITARKGPFWFAEGQGIVDGQVFLKAQMSFALVDQHVQ